MLKAIQLETSHEEGNGVAFYAYFDGEYDAGEVGAALDDEDDDRVSGGAVAPEEVLKKGKEAPSALSKATGLRRFLCAYAG